jgi:hypothetical protein
MALHLMNGEMNEHVHIHEIRGFVSENIMGALNEIYAISRGTKAKQFMYSLSLNPPGKENASTADFEAAIVKAEKKLSLEGQPRVVVFHEKEGRRHAHCVWSRIDSEKMKAIPMSKDHTKLMGLSKSLYLEHGWHMPRGFRDKQQRDPMNFTREEWQQALRTGRKPGEIKQSIQEAFAVSDNRASFEAALKESGFYLARGDRRNVFLVVDLYGETHKLRGKLSLKQSQIVARIGDVPSLRPVAEIKTDITHDMKEVFDKHLRSLSSLHQEQLKPLLRDKDTLKNSHKTERNALIQKQQERQKVEHDKRYARIQKGFRKFTAQLTGRYWRSRKLNEKEAWQSHLRDQKERDDVIARQLHQRQQLQEKFNRLEQEQIKDRQGLVREMGHIHHLEQDHAWVKDMHIWAQEKSPYQHKGDDLGRER